MADILGIGSFPVKVTPVKGLALSRLKSRLDVMEREAHHLLTAVRDMKNGLARNDNRLTTSGVMNSRNWALSVVMSHCYVQNLLGADSHGGSGFAGYLTPSASVQSRTLFQRAAELGTDDGVRDSRA
jgi:hypothetical protein